MKKNYNVIYHIVTAFLQASLAHRADFLQSIFGSLMWSAMSFISAFLLTSQSSQVIGISRVDFLLLAACYGVIVGLHHFLFTHSFQRVPEIIAKGELETYLLKPVDTLTMLSLLRVSWASTIRWFASLIVLGILLTVYHISVGVSQIVGFIFLSLFSVMFIYSIYAITITALIWNPYLSNLLELVNTGLGTARYPLDIVKYAPGLMSILFVPSLLIVNIPTQALIGRLTFQFSIFYCIGVTFFFLFARWWWSRALRWYSGAGS